MMSDLPVRYDAMCRAIDAAYQVDEVKDIRDKALAFEVYARQAKNIEAERRACEIRLRAERKAGALDKQREKAQGARGTGSNQHQQVGLRNGTPPTLADLGISKRQMHDWRKLDDVPEEQFEAALADPHNKPTTAGIIREATAPSPERVAVSNEALWLWGRLRDFEQDGLLNKDPAEILLTMTDRMLDDVHRLAPQVGTWLYAIGKTDVL